MGLSELISAQSVLWMLTFVGFIVNYNLRINVNIGVIAMVKSRHNPINSTNEWAESECYQPVREESATSVENHGSGVLHEVDEDKFDWDEHVQEMILGAFFWSYWVTQIPGGVLAQRFGTKMVYGLSNLIPCLLSFLIPPAAHFHYSVVVVIRILQGLINGLAWPAMHTMVGQWIPPNDRSKFVTSYLGSSVGAAITFPLYGFLIDWLGWPSVFHATGILGIAWFVCWWYLVFDTPAQHPRISPEEKDYIEKALGSIVSEKKPPTPWKSIMTSIPVWMAILAHWGSIWGFFTMLTQAPTYFKTIHGFDIKMTGILSGLPHGLRTVFALAVSFVADYILKHNIMTRTRVRKIATSICTLGQGFCFALLAVTGCNSTAAVVLLALGIMVSGSVSSGILATYVDVSPNFAGVVMGFSGLIVVIPGFISPIIVGYLTFHDQTVGQWNIVFIISAIMLFVPGILYVIFGTSELQPWNSPSTEKANGELPVEEAEKLLGDKPQNNIQVIPTPNKTEADGIVDEEKNTVTNASDSVTVESEAMPDKKQEEGAENISGSEFDVKDKVTESLSENVENASANNDYTETKVIVDNEHTSEPSEDKEPSK